MKLFLVRDIIWNELDRGWKLGVHGPVIPDCKLGRASSRRHPWSIRGLLQRGGMPGVGGYCQKRTQHVLLKKQWC